MVSEAIKRNNKHAEKPNFPPSKIKINCVTKWFIAEKEKIRTIKAPIKFGTEYRNIIMPISTAP